jgi:hypothetical protein
MLVLVVADVYSLGIGPKRDQARKTLTKVPTGGFKQTEAPVAGYTSQSFPVVCCLFICLHYPPGLIYKSVMSSFLCREHLALQSRAQLMYPGFGAAPPSNASVEVLGGHLLLPKQHALALFQKICRSSQGSNLHNHPSLYRKEGSTSI